MSVPSDTEVAVRRELLRIALQNSARTVPLQLIAVGVVVFFGFEAGAYGSSTIAVALGLAVAVWRLALSYRYPATETLPERKISRATKELEGNSALAGILWAVCAIGIYPLLKGTSATTFMVIVIGSVATAALFMSLVGRAFLWLVTLSLGSVTIASVAFESVRSLSLAILAPLFALTLARASQVVSNTTARAIRHGLEEDLANASLLLAKEAAEAANLAKSQFLATMSHEIRTPMNGVLGSLEVLRHSKLDARQRSLVSTAASSGSSLMDILNDVLDHSKIEAGKLHIARAPTSIHTLVHSVANLFRANAEGKGLKLLLDLNPHVADWVFADAQRLKQILLNLIGNAIKFTERGGITVSLQPEEAPDDLARMTFEVHDTGIGLPPEAVANLFQPFHQVSGSNKKRVGGTGLGLAISQRIAEAMGSRIEVQSQVGIGSRFWFTVEFERDSSNSHPLPLDSSMGGLEGEATFEGSALVVEDNEVNRMIAREVLVSLGMRVHEAADGVEALDALTKDPYDLVLMDCFMPVLDGYETAREIRRREAQGSLGRVPIVAVTANAFDDDAAQALAAGMDAHLSKPYTRAQLREILQAWL